MRCLKKQPRSEQSRDSQREHKPVARQLVLGRLVGFSPPFGFVRCRAYSCLCRYSAFTRSFGPPTYSVFFSLSLFVSGCVPIPAGLTSIASASLQFPPFTLPHVALRPLIVALLPAVFFYGRLAPFSSVDSRGAQVEDPEHPVEGH